ncbi:MAG: CHAT domain-containing tetratricopeptide repeat protein [Bacteroidota bacterium]
MFKLLSFIPFAFFFFLAPTLCNDSLTSKIIAQSEELTDANEFQKSIELLQKHLSTLTEHDSLDIASVKHKLAVNYYYEDQLDKAIECISQAIQFRLTVLDEEHVETQSSLFLRVAIYRYQGKLERALVDLERNIKYVQNTPSFSEPTRDSVLMNRYNELGNIFLERKDYYNAIFYWEQVKTYHSNHHPLTLINYQIGDQLATAYMEVGVYDDAIKLFKASIEFYEKAALYSELCISYNNLALTYKLLNNEELTEEYLNQAASNCQKAKDKKNLLEAYANQIENYAHLRKFKEGIATFQKGIKLSKEITSKTFKADLYSNLGLLEATQNDYEGALSHYEEAIQILVPNFESTITNINPTPSEYNIQSKYDLLMVLSRKADALMQKGERGNNLSILQDALQTYEDINELINIIRLDYQISQSKFLLLKRNSQWYEKAIATALLLYEKTNDKNYLEKAYQFNANNKSVVLLDALQDESAKQFAGLPESVLAEEKQWKKAIHECETLLYEVTPNEEKSLKNYKDSLFQLQQGYKDFIQILEQQYPDYYELKYAFTQPPSILEIQAELKEETLLLEYFLGEENAYIFAISRNDFQVHEISKNPNLKTDIQYLNEFLFSPTASQKTKEEYLSIAYQTYQKLIAPALTNVSNPQRLIIIPDDILAQLSFESLLDKPSNQLQTSTSFLVKKYAICYLYSSNFLFLKPKSQKAKNLFGGFGIEYDDTTLESVKEKEALPTRNLQMTLRSMGKLTYSDDEVLAISELLKGEIWLNETATKNAFLTNSNRFQILHLAMHGALNEEQPLQSSLIFTKTKEEDHFLRAGELYNLKLNADMVVLSACNTGAGQLNKGEGVRSLARAFQYAGASSLVASLWSAPDQTTKEIMVSFYQYLKQGLSKDVALQKAKLDYLNHPNTSPEYAHPSYWAHLVVVGEVSALELGSPWIWWITVSILLLIVAFFLLKKTAS